MPSYTDYESLLKLYNWTGLGKIDPDDIYTVLSAAVSQDGSNNYVLKYAFLDDENDYPAYYNTNPEDPEREADAALVQQQKDIYTILAGDDGSFDYTYSVFFEDVAKVKLTSDSIANAHLTLGATTDSNDWIVDGATAEGIDTDYVQAYTHVAGDNDPSPADGNLSSELQSKWGDVWLNEDFYLGWTATGATSPGSIQFGGIMHEMGHALGLSHPAEQGALDSKKYTVMSYEELEGFRITASYPGQDPNVRETQDTVVPSSLQMYDILALQEIYGRNFDTRDTATTYKQGQGFGATVNAPFIYTIWDGGGTDEIDASAYADGVTIDLRQGAFSSIGKAADSGYSGSRGTGLADDNVAIAFHAVIENAIGTSQADTITGNAWDNTIDGGAGNDTIYGDGVVAPGGDNGFGADPGEYDDPDRNDPDAPADDSGADTIDGGAGNDTIYGGAGDDIITGGTGDDTLRGGSGDDTYHYFVGDGQDVIIESWDSDDTVQFGAGINYSNTDISFVDDNMIFEFTDGGRITFQGYLAADQESDDTIEFGDSQTLSWITGNGGTEIGTGDDDLIIGSSAVDFIGGGAGDDTIFGGGEDDNLSGDDGDDRIFGGSGDDSIGTGQGSDTVYGGDGDDTIYIDGGANHVIDGGAGNDDFSTVYPANDITGTLTIDGGAGDDIFRNNHTNSADHIYSDISGDDAYVVGYGSSLSITDLSGNDEYEVIPVSVGGDVSISDTGGIDFIDVNGSPAEYTGYSIVGEDLILNIDALELEFEDYFDISGLHAIENIEFTGTGLMTVASLIAEYEGDPGDNSHTGSASGDIMFGHAGGDTLSGAAGDDILDGGADDDTLNGDGGADRLIGGFGADALSGGDDTDLLFGGLGADSLAGGAGDDDLDGGDGFDAADYSADGAGVTVNLGTGSATDGNSDTDTLTDIEAVIGSDYADTITGDSGDNRLYGGAGNDSILGAAGSDSYVFDLGDGSDTVEDASGSLDYIIFGAGIDPDDLSFAVNSNDLNVDYGSDDVDLIGHLDGGDTKQIERVQTGDGSIFTMANYASWAFGTTGADNPTLTSSADYYWGGEGNDTLSGGDGDDELAGGVGDDTINGGDGDDLLSGGDGSDTIDGGKGTDIIYGGAGDDIIDAGFNGPNDTIYGGDGDDTITSDAWVATIYGGNGDDTITATGSNNTLYGGLGADTLTASSSFGNVIIDREGDHAIADPTGDGYDVLRSKGTIIANSGDNLLDGISGGNTTFKIYFHADSQVGSTNTVQSLYGDDTLILGTLDSDNTDYSWSFNGDGDLILTYTGTLTESQVIIESQFQITNGSDSLTIPVETIEFADSVEIDPFEDLSFVSMGTSSGETINGTSAADVIYTLGGDDTVNAGDGDDLVFTGTGANVVYGEGGHDTISGASGTTSADEFHGGDGNDTIDGWHGDDVLYGDAGDDTIWGRGGSDTIYGGDGDDYLHGEDNSSPYGNADVLYGGDGDDTLIGGGGDDVLYGGAGANFMSGARDADTFVFESATAFDALDTIHVFKASDGDAVDLSDLLSAYDPMADAITDFLEMTVDSNVYTLGVDTDGGADNFVAVAEFTLSQGLSTDEAALESSGVLITV